MKKILVIAYVFPPIAYAGTHRTLRLCQQLAARGYHLDILTIDIQNDLHNDFNLLDKIKNKVNIVRTPIQDPYRFYRKLKTNFGEGFLNKIFLAFAGLIVETISIPDHMVYWIVNAIRPALQMTRENNYSIIYTTSPPHSVQIIGYLLKRKMPWLKWVADLRDPILDNLMIDHLAVHNRYIHKWLEKQISETADAVVFNTDFAKKSFKKRYQHPNVQLIRNSYDESSFSFDPGPAYENFTISHVGSIYSFRNVDPLFEAVLELEKVGKLNSKNFKLLFVGLNDPILKEKIKAFGIERFVEIQEMVPHKKAIEIMLRSHLLLLVKGFGKNSGSQIPGKLYEYLASGNPIMHLGPSKSEAAAIIDSANAGKTFSEDINPISDFIYKHYQMFVNQHLPKESLTDRGKFSSKNMADQMSRLFERLQ